MRVPCSRVPEKRREKSDRLRKKKKFESSGSTKPDNEPDGAFVSRVPSGNGNMNGSGRVGDMIFKTQTYHATRTGRPVL